MNFIKRLPANIIENIGGAAIGALLFPIAMAELSKKKLDAGLIVALSVIGAVAGASAQKLLSKRKK